MKPTHRMLLSLIGLLSCTPLLHAQHGHLTAGAFGTTQDSQIYFANGAIFAAESGYVQNMTLAESGRFAGYYNSGPTFTALPQTIDNGGPTANAPALGSFLEVRMEFVLGPTGSFFSFWDSGATVPSITMAAGNTTPSSLWDLSDVSVGAGQVGADPFGHLHGRRFTATELGTYTVGFKVFDTSSNGANGGPIHASSETFQMTFQAVPEPGTLALVGLGIGTAAVMMLRRRARANS